MGGPSACAKPQSAQPAQPAQPVQPAQPTQPTQPAQRPLRRRRTSTLQLEFSRTKLRKLENSRKLLLQKRHGKPWYVLEPLGIAATSIQLASAASVALIYFILPFEIAFADLPQIPDPRSGIFIFNCLVDVVFTVELVMTFFISFPTSAAGSGATDPTDEEDLREGNFVSKAKRNEYRLSHIAMHYLKSWFVIDLAALIPSALELDVMLSSTSGEDASSLPDNTAVETMRAIRLIKLIRVARLIKMLRMAKVFKTVLQIKEMAMREGSLLRHARDRILMATVGHSRKRRVINLLLGMLILTHMQACILGMSALFADEKVDSWWGTHGYCFPEELYRLSPRDPWKTRCVDALSQYMVAYTITLGMNFKLPFRPIVMEGPGVVVLADDSNAPFSQAERGVFVTIGFTGVLVGLYLTGAFVGVVTMRDGATTSEQVTRFCKQHSMPISTHQELQLYFSALEELSNMVPNAHLFRRLSPAVAKKIIFELHGIWLRKQPFYEPLTHPSLFANGPKRSPSEIDSLNYLLCKMALRMEPSLFIPKEKPGRGCMYVIIKGSAVLQGTASDVLLAGRTWGAASLVLSSSSFAVGSGDVKALTDLQTISISQSAFQQIVAASPDLKGAYLRLRVWYLHRRLYYGVRRAANMVMIARDVKSKMHQVLTAQRLLHGHGRPSQPDTCNGTVNETTSMEKRGTNGEVSDELAKLSTDVDRKLELTNEHIRKLDAKIDQIHVLLQSSLQTPEKSKGESSSRSFFKLTA